MSHYHCPQPKGPRISSDAAAGQVAAVAIDVNDSLPVITLNPSLEQLLHNVLQQSASSQGLVIEPKLAEGLCKALAENTAMVENQGHPAVLVVSPGIRPWLAKIIRHRLSDLTVLSYSEIPDDQAVKVVATVDVEETN